MSTNEQTKAALLQAKQYINDPANWIKEAFATDANNKVVSPQNPKATCFCILGALERAVDKLDINLSSTYDSCYNVLSHLAAKAGFDSVGAFNDDEETTHGEVMGLFDDAIKKLG